MTQIADHIRNCQWGSANGWALDVCAGEAGWGMSPSRYRNVVCLRLRAIVRGVEGANSPR